MAGGQGHAAEPLVVRSIESATAAIRRLLTAMEGSFARRAQLEEALESRIVIEQAKGVIGERLGTNVEEAFELLRRASRDNRIKLRDLAAGVRPGQELPPEIAAVARANDEHEGRHLTSEMDERGRRVGFNEAVFRDVNERMRSSPSRQV